MSIVLSKQVQASREAAEALQAEILSNHRWAILAREVKDLTTDAVQLLRRIEQHVERWQDELLVMPDDDRQKRDLQAMESTWDRLYRDHWTNFQSIAKVLKSVEGWGFVVDGKEAFLTAYGD